MRIYGEESAGNLAIEGVDSDYPPQLYIDAANEARLQAEEEGAQVFICNIHWGHGQRGPRNKRLNAKILMGEENNVGLQGFDVVFSGYRSKRWDDWVLGGGCFMINRSTLAQVGFRCYEFKNGKMLFEDEFLDVDLFRCRARIRKGIFAANRHYTESGQYYAIEPRPMGWWRSLTNQPMVKYLLVRTSLLVGYNLARRLRRVNKRITSRRIP